MTINKRIELIIKYLGMNNNSFSKKINVNPTVIHNIIKGRNKPSYDILTAILSTFDNINPTWLLTGEGEMLRENVGGTPPPRRPPEVPAQELEALRREVQLLRKLVDTLEATVAAKDIIIGQLQRALDRLERER